MVRIDLPPYPNGWFAVGTSEDVPRGGVVTRRYFGEELVLFRDVGDRIQVLDAHCAHLGAHLGDGAVGADGCLVCPFHGWRWSGNGTCVGMPYGNRVPPAARIRSWPAVEQDGVVLVWHDSSGIAPHWEMPTFGDRRWTATRSMRRTIRTHPQEVLENTVDFAHFRFIHETHVMRPTAEPRIEGPTFELWIECDPEAVEPGLRLPPGDFLPEGSTFDHGPGLAGATITGKGSPVQVLQRLYATPVDGELVDLLGVVSIAIDDGFAEADALAVAEQVSEAVFQNWDLDIPIWERKRYQPRPVLNATEKLIPVFRRWYSQFYDPIPTEAAARELAGAGS